MKSQKTIAERIKEALAHGDAEAIKALKDEIERDQWLNKWRARGSKMEDWLGPNPLIRWV